MKPPLYLVALTGLGDNIHGRAIVPKLCERYEVWLKTKYPEVFADIHGLRFDCESVPPEARVMTLGYVPQYVKRYGSIVEAMAANCGVKAGNFLLPATFDQLRDVARLLRERGYQVGGGKRLLVYRPLVLVANTPDDNVQAKLARNPDPAAYFELVAPIRYQFFTVGVADCRDGREALLPSPIKPDLQFVNGELTFSQLVALFSLANLVYSSPGFATVLAQAVCTPSITVFGGFEDAHSFTTGAEYAPWLPIQPIETCPCWSPNCPGDKTIDLPVAARRIEKFIGGLNDYWQI